MQFKNPHNSIKKKWHNGGEFTWHYSFMITDIVSIGLPVVPILRAVKGVKCYWRSWWQILHQHLEFLIDQGPTGANRQNGRDGLGHGQQPSVKMFKRVNWLQLSQDS